MTLVIFSLQVDTDFKCAFFWGGGGLVDKTICFSAYNETFLYTIRKVKVTQFQYTVDAFL